MRKRILIVTMVLIIVFTFINYGENTNAKVIELQDIRVGMVTDSGTLYDNSFNQSTWEGIQKAAKEFNLDSTYFKPIEPTESSFIQQINNLIDSGYNLIVTPGVRFESTIFKAQNQYKNVKFIIVNTVPTDKGKVYVADNTVAILLSEHEAGFLVGVATAIQLKDGKVGFIGGLEVPTVQRFNWGFQQGIKYANKNFGTKIEISPEDVVYTGSFTNSTETQKLAAEMYNRGVRAIFVKASESAIGAINEAKKRAFSGKEAWIIGVERDQYDEGIYMPRKSVILTSAIRKLGDATYEVIKDSVEGKFPGGKTLIYDTKNNGVGIPEKNPNLSEETIKKVNEVYEKIKSGEIKISPEKDGLIK
ncbi:nucleoside-binding protein [Clostridium cavendishii DSM 21758]|uniref:Nucleoside-binding protein n=1 Tax=Clostridium cavendishii DSM 21758 TaxID=1121302 RepID=A0A1M6R6R0_9CLOT|nr:BMP family ABC transporter substrate-binding protein [Clostridium cavendishii]SHK28152.1 nucleoside-binding protein [Clostridium cavendishii DSM 21758]